MKTAQMVDVPSRQISQILTLSFVAHSHHGIDRIYSNGGRAEPMKKAKRNVFFMAQVHHGVDDNLFEWWTCRAINEGDWILIR